MCTERYSSIAEDKALKDDEILQNLPVGTTATMYFRDLGPQIGWTMVSCVKDCVPILNAGFTQILLHPK